MRAIIASLFTPAAAKPLTTPGAAVFRHLPPAAGLAILFALSACKTTPGPVEVRTVFVNVPVSVSCIKPGMVPAPPPKIGALLNGDSQHDLNLVAASAIRLRAYGDVLLALVSACK